MQKYIKLDKLHYFGYKNYYFILNYILYDVILPCRDFKFSKTVYPSELRKKDSMEKYMSQSNSKRIDELTIYYLLEMPLIFMTNNN